MVSYTSYCSSCWNSAAILEAFMISAVGVILYILLIVLLSLYLDSEGVQLDDTRRLFARMQCKHLKQM
ncbi:hypothetical protein BDR06DRAFT_706140 [Suillus hirtellus]|nr:hypothetical protein BDR06DRAFT_706140 [Suillus hirtellus]